MSDHREAIAEVLCDAMCHHESEHHECVGKADRLLGSDVLAQIRAEARAEALREAARDVGPALQNEVGGHTSTYSVRQWLNARAEGSA